VASVELTDGRVRLTWTLGLEIRRTMSYDDLTKVVIGVTSAFVGWILAQFTSFVKSWIQRRKIVKLLNEELNDISSQVDRLLFFYTRELQIYGAKCIDHSNMVGITSPIYNNYYKDAILSLSKSQRMSFQMIHSLVDYGNKILEEFNELTNELQKEARANGTSEKIVVGGKHWGELAKNGYSNCAIIKWHIDYHINNKKHHDLSPFTKTHKDYLKYTESVNIEMDKIIESGKNIKKEQFEKIYDSRHFETHP
jgi:hypothetical protein